MGIVDLETYHPTAAEAVCWLSFLAMTRQIAANLLLECEDLSCSFGSAWGSVLLCGRAEGLGVMDVGKEISGMRTRRIA